MSGRRAEAKRCGHPSADRSVRRTSQRGLSNLKYPDWPKKPAFSEIKPISPCDYSAPASASIAKPSPLD
jgi:hypothetical protein